MSVSKVHIDIVLMMLSLMVWLSEMLTVGVVFVLNQTLFRLERMVNGMLMIVDRFNIMLVVESVVELMMILMFLTALMGVVAIFVVVLILVRMGFWVVERVVHGTLVVVDWLNIMLVIESMIKFVMCLMVLTVTFFVLVSVVTVVVAVFNIIFVLFVMIGVGLRTINGLQHSVLMEVYWLNIVLIIKSMVDLMMGLMSFTVVFLVMAAVLVLVVVVRNLVATLMLMVRIVVAVFMSHWVFEIHTIAILVAIVFIVRLLVL